MPDLTDEVLRHLQSEEPDYGSAVASLSAEALPALESIAREADPLLAAKATHLASMIGSPEARRVVEAAAERPEPEVRLAAAAAVRNLSPSTAISELADVAGTRVLDRLLRDEDPGVRKFALKSAAALDLQDRVRNAAANDPAEFVRQTAKKALQRRPRR